MKKKIMEYIEQNFKNIVVVSGSIILGIIVGSILYQVISSGIQNDLVRTMKNTLELTKSENFEGINIIKNGMISNLILVAVIYLMSLTLISPYLISMLSFFKGLSIGMYIPTLFNIFGISKGLLAMLLLIIIPNLVYIPSYIYLSVNSIRFHYSLLGNESKMIVFTKEFFKVVLGFSVMFLGVILEQVTSYWVILLYASI